MIYRDYIPGEQMKGVEIVPPGMDYWQPTWKLVDGKIIKNDLIQQAKDESLELKGSSFFQCSHCDFKTESEPGIKRHVTTKHKRQIHECFRNGQKC